MTDSTPGALGRYEIQGILGKGAMGVVYKARDPLIGRVLAIKTFRTAYMGDDHEVREFRARFLREAQSAGILNHPNIVTIHDVVEESEEGITFIAMEYVEGTNLKEVLRRGEPLDFGRISHIVSEVAEALDYAHEKGVIHRDIKPANILLTSSGQVKLTDFGIARLEASDLTQDGQLLGTPNYMAPERILGRDVDRRTDVFSLGVVLYEMLTREKPFRGDNLTMVTHRIVYEPFTPPVDFDLDFPPEVVRVLGKSMAKEPADRFATAGEMAAELQVAVRLAQRSGFAMESAGGSVAPSSDEGDEDARTQDVSDHAAEVAAAGGAVEELPDVEGIVGDAPEGWAGEPPGGTRDPEDTVAVSRASMPPPAPRSDSTVPVATAAPSSAAPAAAGPDVGSGSAARSPGTRLGKKAAAVGLAAILGILLLVVAVVFWPGSGAETPQPAETSAVSREGPASRYLERARTAMADGELGRADRYLREGLLAAPDDPDLQALRREVGDALTAAELSAERDAQLESWLASTRAHLDEGDLDGAERTLERLFLLAPEHEEARALESRIAEARAAAERERRSRQASRAQAAEPEPEVEPAAAEVSEAAEPSYFDLSIVFLTEISEGTLTIYAGDQQIVREPFDFRRRTGLFRSEESAGQIAVDRRLPRGDTTLRVYVARQGGAPLVETLRQAFRGGSEPTLRIVVRKNGSISVEVEEAEAE